MAATAGVAVLTAAVERWPRDVGGLDEDQLWVVGRSRAAEVDQQAPSAHLVLHLDRELGHHGAQIAVLRDHYRASSSAWAAGCPQQPTGSPVGDPHVSPGQEAPG